MFFPRVVSARETGHHGSYRQHNRRDFFIDPITSSIQVGEGGGGRGWEGGVGGTMAAFSEPVSVLGGRDGYRLSVVNPQRESERDIRLYVHSTVG